MDTLPDRSVTHVGKLYCHLCRRVQQLTKGLKQDHLILGRNIGITHPNMLCKLYANENISVEDLAQNKKIIV